MTMSEPPPVGKQKHVVPAAGQEATVRLAEHSRRDVLSRGGASFKPGPPELMAPYRALLLESKLVLVEEHRLNRILGSGGQGVVYLGERVGADEFRLPVALKLFSPGGYADAGAYDAAMTRMAQVAARVARIQQDNLIDVHNLSALDRIRIMEMEWVDGYDLQRLLAAPMLGRLREVVSAGRWKSINDVVVTAGPTQARLKPGVAIAVLRDCLAALAALHREGIIHGDIKPSNIMVKRTGDAKLIDIGSAHVRGSPDPPVCTPVYAAPELLEGSCGSPQSDLVSLGYVLVEMLAGKPPFAGTSDHAALGAAKRALPARLKGILPQEVLCNGLLMSFIAKLIAPNPPDRFASAEEADFLEQGAASFHRQLVHSNLASEYGNEIRAWLEHID
jgi:serine/threonine-protein kinase